MKKVVSFRPLFYIFIFLLCGIVSARKIFAGDILLIVLLSLGFLLLTIWLCAYKKYKFLAILILTFLLGGGLFFAGEACYKINSFSQPVAVIGRVTDGVKEGNYYYSVILDDVKINGKGDKNISLQIAVDDGKEIKAGDELVFETTLESISLWTLKNFNTYYYRSNIGYKAKINSSTITSLEGGLKLDETIRLGVKASLEKNLSGENAGLCYALLFGDKVEVSSETLGSYKDAGVIHILAVSGLHVSFLLSLILGIMKLCKVNKYLSFVLTSILVLFFAYLCSFTPSVVRAGLMAIFFMLSKLVGRRYDTLSSLGLAGIIILLFSPLTALDIGFLLSVFCVIGISLLSKILNKLFIKVMPKQFASALSVSLACQLTTIPLTAFFGGQFNFLSPFINLIIVPFFGILFPYLVVVVVISAILPFMGFLLVPAGWGFSGVTSVVRFFGNTSFMLPIEKVHLTLTLLFFILLFVFSKFVLLSAKKKGIIVGCLAIMICLCGLVNFYKGYDDSKTVVMLSSYSQSCYIFTSSNGERLAVGFNDLLDDYSRQYNVKNIDYFLSFEPIDDDDVDNLSSFGTGLFLACSGDLSIEEGEYSSQGDCGDFSYQFLKSDEKVLGVGIKFDLLKIFIASVDKEGYNEIYENYLSSFKPNVVFVEDNNEIAKDYVTISQEENDSSWASFEKNRNTKFYFSGGYMFKEALD